ncbi:MAG: hypothetical protein ACD_4C00487G0010 [uncultured bacterium (gcode 4)]|uniref:30S ribosomal protein S17 n=1 Tax=uncultured bacterium (gcode 4) TaxID=1234023 RepID=K2G790_9BACT|nr:MAG: hypothetical protein ACD_4C00487G0010 [uncultured bacterium (gcode 4)]
MRTLSWIVTSIKMNKTVVVTIDDHKTHPKYKKKFKVSNKFYAHDESNACILWQAVNISETKPLSKLKRWIVM